MASVSYINTVLESASTAAATEESFTTTTLDNPAAATSSASASISSAFDSAATSPSSSAASLQSATGTTSSIASATTTGASTTLPSSSSNSNPSSSLSPGAIAGIVAGVVALVLLIAVTWIYKIRRSKRQSVQHERPESSYEKWRRPSSGTSNSIGIIPGVNDSQTGEPESPWSPQLGSSGFSSTSRLLDSQERTGAPISPTPSISEPRRPPRSQFRIFGDTGQPDDLESGNGRCTSNIRSTYKDGSVPRTRQHEQVGGRNIGQSLQQLRAEQAALEDQIRAVKTRKQELCQPR